MAVNRDNFGGFPGELVGEEIFGSLFGWVYALNGRRVTHGIFIESS
jgi:hypothetical protein